MSDGIYDDHDHEGDCWCGVDHAASLPTEVPATPVAEESSDRSNSPKRSADLVRKFIKEVPK